MNTINIENMPLTNIVLGTDGYGERIDVKTANKIIPNMELLSII